VRPDVQVVEMPTAVVAMQCAGIAVVECMKNNP
jgi:hypothetical protein